MLNVQEGFDSVVLTGVRAQNGMVSFADRLDAEDTANIRSFLVSQAIEALAREQAAPVIESVDTQDVHTDEEETAEN